MVKKKATGDDKPVAFRGSTEVSYPGKDRYSTSVGMNLYYFDSGTTSTSGKQGGNKGHYSNSNHNKLGDCFFHIVLLRHIVMGANKSLLPIPNLMITKASAVPF